MRRSCAPCPHQGKADSLRRIWKATGSDGEFYVVRRQDRRACEEPEDIRLTLTILERWIRDPALRPQLVQMCSILGAPVPSRPDGDLIKLFLKRAFESGDLLLVRAPLLSLGPGKEEGRTERAAPPAPPPRETGRKTWVELRLVDMEGNPVGGKHYRIETPNGGVEEGFLDDSGRVRLNGIDGGSCRFMFPDLDQEAWERAPD